MNISPTCLYPSQFLLDGNVAICSMLGPVVLEINWIWQIMAFGCESTKQLVESTAAHLSATYSGMSFIGHCRQWIHWHCCGTTWGLPTPITPLVALPHNTSARAHRCWHGRVIVCHLVQPQVLTFPIGLWHNQLFVKIISSSANFLTTLPLVQSIKCHLV